MCLIPILMITAPLFVSGWMGRRNRKRTLNDLRAMMGESAQTSNVSSNLRCACECQKADSTAVDPILEIEALKSAFNEIKAKARMLQTRLEALSMQALHGQVYVVAGLKESIRKQKR